MIIVANNSAWGMIKSVQQFYFKQHYIDTNIPEFDYRKCPEGFGCYGESISDPNEIKNDLQRAKDSNKPAVIDIKIKF